VTTAPQADERLPGRQRDWPVTTRTAFFVLLLVVLAVYTQMAFELEWETAAGRIGPGFFPRIIGVLGLLLTAVALVGSLRGEPEQAAALAGDDDEMGEGDLGRHPVALLLMVLGAAAYVFLLTVLGAVVASAAFLAGVLWWLNPGRHVTNLVLTVLLPVGMYLLFQTLLNAGLPVGVLGLMPA
jgi:putative tricarboxylic transport membrane protein